MTVRASTRIYAFSSVKERKRKNQNNNRVTLRKARDCIRGWHDGENGGQKTDETDSIKG